MSQMSQRRVFLTAGAAATTLFVLVLWAKSNTNNLPDNERWFSADRAPYGRPASPPDTPAELQEMEDMADWVYAENGFLNRARKDYRRTIDNVEADWPCMWGEEVIGTLQPLNESWWNRWNDEKYFIKDGWKYICGLRKIQSPCVVYSLGSSGNMAFEAAIAKIQPGCEIYIFDKDSFGIETWFTKEQQQRVHFTKAFISGHEDLTNDPPLRTLASIMAEHAHTHIDILKVDIEGNEYDLFAPGPLPSIGQMQFEVHTTDKRFGGNREAEEAAYTQLVSKIESGGHRMFHKEMNLRYDPFCFELAFIQSRWRPGTKRYDV